MKGTIAKSHTIRLQHGNNDKWGYKLEKKSDKLKKV